MTAAVESAPTAAPAPATRSHCLALSPISACRAKTLPPTTTTFVRLRQQPAAAAVAAPPPCLEAAVGDGPARRLLLQPRETPELFSWPTSKV